MAINSTSTAAACMSILTDSRQREYEKNAPSGGGSADFSRLLQQFLGGSPSAAAGTPVTDINMIRESYDGNLFGMPTREKYIPLTSFTEYVRSPVTDTTSWRAEDAYARFRENFLNSPEPGDLKLSDSQRLENLAPILPGSVEEAGRRFQSAYEHLNNYMHTAVDDMGLEIDFRYAPVTVSDDTGAQANGLGGMFRHTLSRGAGREEIKQSREEEDRDIKKFIQYQNTPEGRDMRMMAEEVQLYGAIASLAEKDAGFRAAYDADPAAAVEKYSARLIRGMHGVELPEIQTIPDNWAQLHHTRADWDEMVKRVESHGRK